MELIRRNKKYIVLGLLPALLIYTVFIIYPILNSFYYGFFDWNGLGTPIFTGFKNIQNVLQAPVFWNAFKNNIMVVLASIFGQIPIGLLLAIALSKKMHGAAFFRTIFFMPMILSTVVIGLLWTTVLNSQVGILNRLLNMMGLQFLTKDWLGDPNIAMFTVCAIIVWQCVGQYMIIFIAALQNVSQEVLEAADIDGANERQKLFRIILPSIWGSIIASVVMCIAGSMRSFDLVYVLTNGGPAHATEVMATYMYNQTFTGYKYGYGSAISLVIFILSFSFILISRALMRRNEQDN